MNDGTDFELRQGLPYHFGLADVVGLALNLKKIVLVIIKPGFDNMAAVRRVVFLLAGHWLQLLSLFSVAAADSCRIKVKGVT
jgi:hypothetical protein